MSKKYYKKKPIKQGICACGNKFLGQGKYCIECKVNKMYNRKSDAQKVRRSKKITLKQL